jgi:hypothetical protein
MSTETNLQSDVMACCCRQTSTDYKGNLGHSPRILSIISAIVNFKRKFSSNRPH